MGSEVQDAIYCLLAFAKSLKRSKYCSEIDLAVQKIFHFFAYTKNNHKYNQNRQIDTNLSKQWSGGGGYLQLI